MAIITKIVSTRNTGVAVTQTAGAASATILYDRSDENNVIMVTNGDAAACRVKIPHVGNGDDINVDIAASGVAIIGAVESMGYKNATDSTIEVQVLDQDNTAFSGTVTNVTFAVIELPKALLD